MPRRLLATQNDTRGDTVTRASRSIVTTLIGQGGRQLGSGAVAALPLTVLIGWGFSRYFPSRATRSGGSEPEA